MKKFVTILLIMLMALSAINAETEVRFILSDVDQHSEILIGFCPTYLLLGLGVDFHFIDDNNRSEFQFLVGGGYTQKRLFVNPYTGEPEYHSPVDINGDLLTSGTGITYDTVEGDFIIRYDQGFLDDLLTLRTSIEMKYEMNLNSHKTDKFPPLNTYLGGPTSLSSTLFPDVAGSNSHFLGMALALRLTYDAMDDTIFTNDGILAYVEAKYAPLFLNNWLDGSANYYSLTANAVFSKTLYTYSTENYDWFSIVLIDRVNANWTDGSVPVFAQEPVSLGRKVRGYNTLSYGTQFSAVNNLDIRFAGPGIGIASIKPRINVFFDMGIGAGNYFNSTISPDKGYNFLSSVGAQFTVTFFDFIDLGYQIAYLFTGEKMTDPGSRFVTTFTFFLDF